MKSVGQVAETPQGQTAKRKRPLYTLYVANAVSYVGDDLTLLAIPWFVLQTTGSVTALTCNYRLLYPGWFSCWSN